MLLQTHNCGHFHAVGSNPRVRRGTWDTSAFRPKFWPQKYTLLEVKNDSRSWHHRVQMIDELTHTSPSWHIAGCPCLDKHRVHLCMGIKWMNPSFFVFCFSLLSKRRIQDSWTQRYHCTLWDHRKVLFILVHHGKWASRRRLSLLPSFTYYVLAEPGAACT